MSTGPLDGGRPPTPPQRVRVTRTRRRLSAGPRPSLREEVDAQSSLGTTYVDSLQRAQLRLALRVVLGLAVLLGTIPLLSLLAPSLADVTLGGVPLPWLVLGVLVYPLVVLTAAWFTRASERLEEEFSEVVDEQ